MGVTASQSLAAKLQRRHIVPIVLGVVMLAVVVAAVLTTNSGGVQAQTSSQPLSSASFSWTNAGLAALVVVPGGLLALFLWGRPRPSATRRPTMQLAQEGSNPPSGPLGTAASQAPATTAAAAHRETARDAGHVSPAVPVAATGAAGAVPVEGVAATGKKTGSHIGWLMAEIDEVYRERAKRDHRIRLWERAHEPSPVPWPTTGPSPPKRP
jgi:hypothetical protein